MGAEQSIHQTHPPAPKVTHSGTNPDDHESENPSPPQLVQTSLEQQQLDGVTNSIAALLGDDSDDAATTSAATAAASPLHFPSKSPLISKLDPASSIQSLSLSEFPSDPLELPPAAAPIPTRRTRTGIGESHLELWHSLVEWVGPLTSEGTVLAWDSEEVASRILALPEDGRFIRTLTQRHLQRRAARADARQAKEARERVGGIPGKDASNAVPAEMERLSENTRNSSSVPSGISNAVCAVASGSGSILPSLPPSAHVPFDLAEQLLNVDPALSAMRLKAVPARVSEDTFWEVYFSAILVTIKEHVDELHRQRKAATPQIKPSDALPTPHTHVHASQVDALP
jgi:hypothetical protein